MTSTILFEGSPNVTAEDVRRDLAAAKEFEDEDWPDPIPIDTEIECPESYPLHALPEVLHRAVSEVSRFVKVPVE